MNRTQRANIFVGKCVKDLVQNGISVEFINERTVDCGGFPVSGYFDSEEKVLKIAAKRKNWLPLFVHEYCHFLQWKEGIFDDYEAEEDIDDWYRPNCPFDLKKAIELVKLQQGLEVDCEKRAVKLMKRHQLPINVKEYIRQANFSLYVDYLSVKSKQWVGGGLEGYDEIKKFIPVTFQKDYSNCPEDLREYIEGNYF